MCERDYEEGEPPGQPLDSLAFVDEGYGSKTHTLPSSQRRGKPPVLGGLIHEQTFPNEPEIKMVLPSMRAVHYIQRKAFKVQDV